MERPRCPRLDQGEERLEGMEEGKRNWRCARTWLEAELLEVQSKATTIMRGNEELREQTKELVEKEKLLAVLIAKVYMCD